MRRREREEGIDGLENAPKKLHRPRRIIPNSGIARGNVMTPYGWEETTTMSTPMLDVFSYGEGCDV